MVRARLTLSSERKNVALAHTLRVLTDLQSLRYAPPVKFADQDHPLWNVVQRRALGELRALGGTVDLDVRLTGCGYTALERATAGKPDVDLIDALLEAGASPNARGRCSPLERLVVANGRELRIGPHTVAGVLSLDVTPKPDTRRPVYFARTAW